MPNLKRNIVLKVATRVLPGIVRIKNASYVCKVSHVHHHVLILPTETTVKCCVTIAKICLMHPQDVKILPQTQTQTMKLSKNATLMIRILKPCTKITGKLAVNFVYEFKNNGQIVLTSLRNHGNLTRQPKFVNKSHSKMP